jgi:hypothetical protein
MPGSHLKTPFKISKYPKTNTNRLVYTHVQNRIWIDEAVSKLLSNRLDGAMVNTTVV